MDVLTYVRVGNLSKVEGLDVLTEEELKKVIETFLDTHSTPRSSLNMWVYNLTPQEALSHTMLNNNYSYGRDTMKWITGGNFDLYKFDVTQRYVFMCGGNVFVLPGVEAPTEIKLNRTLTIPV